MSAPAFGTIGTLLATTTGTPAFAVPASVASGDIIVVYAFIDNAATTISALPTGFAQCTASPRTVNSGGTESHVLMAAWKRATGADTGTYSFTLSGSTFVYGQATRYTGAVSSGNPWDTAVSADGSTTFSTSCPNVLLTTLGPDRLITYCGTNWNGDGGSWSAPTGYSQRSSGVSGTTDCEISDVVQATAGGTGNVHATDTASGAVGSWLGALIGTTVTSTVAPAIVIAQTAVDRAYSW